MDRPYVEWLRVEGYRCIKSVDLHLTPLHALIGPNDSGKSSILRAMQDSRALTWWANDDSGWVQGRPGSIADSGKSQYPARERSGIPMPQWIVHAARRIAMLRLDPDELRHPAGLLAPGAPLWFANEEGRGLATLYDALLGRDRRGFTAIEDRFRALFPTVATLRLDPTSSAEKALGLTLVDGTAVGPREMSEGMLYWLAFAIVEQLAPQAILLIEEPENGLHPARIAEVVRVLREVSTRTQVILATHSPILINELRPEEVTIVTRTAERGTICTPMTATPHFETRSKVYALGELWVSYADGDLERGLVGPDPGAAKVAAE